MRLRQADIRTHWKSIKPYIEDILVGYDELSEEVYAACRYKEAFLFVSEDGFIILQEQIDQRTNKKDLFVWFAQGYFGNTNLFASYEAELLEIAKTVGASKLTFNTTRKGFERLNPEGWKMTYIKYEKEVN